MGETWRSVSLEFKKERYSGQPSVGAARFRGWELFTYYGIIYNFNDICRSKVAKDGSCDYMEVVAFSHQYGLWKCPVEKFLL